MRDGCPGAEGGGYCKGKKYNSLVWWERVRYSWSLLIRQPNVVVYQNAAGPRGEASYDKQNKTERHEIIFFF